MKAVEVKAVGTMGGLDVPGGRGAKDAVSGLRLLPRWSFISSKVSDKVFQYVYVGLRLW